MKENNEVIEGEVVEDPTLADYTNALTLEDYLKTCDDIQRQFLIAYQECGTVTHAAIECKMHRSTPYIWVHRDPGFKLAMGEAHKAWFDNLKKAAYDRAMAKSDLLLMFLMKAEDRGKYDDNQAHVRVTGDIIFKCEIPHAYDRKQLKEGKD